MKKDFSKTFAVVVTDEKLADAIEYAFRKSAITVAQLFTNSVLQYAYKKSVEFEKPLDLMKEQNLLNEPDHREFVKYARTLLEALDPLKKIYMEEMEDLEEHFAQKSLKEKENADS